MKNSIHIEKIWEWLKIIIPTAFLLVIMLLTFSSCRESETVSYNLSQEADNFKVLRRITFINTITDTVLYTVEGNISITSDNIDGQLEITAKTGDDSYQKHFLSVQPTTAYIVEQLEWNEVDKYRFKITFRPEIVIPDIDVQTSFD